MIRYMFSVHLRCIVVVSVSGFCADFMRSIASMCGFAYDLRPNKLGVYGRKFENQSWNGMIGELIAKVCLLA